MAKIESGLQLLKRLIARPELRNLCSELFLDGLELGQVVEISGDVSSGKTLLLTNLIATCILAQSHAEVQIGGKSAGVLLIDTDHHFNMFSLVKILDKTLQSLSFSKTDKKAIVQQSLKRLIILNVFNLTELFAAFETMGSTLNDQQDISLVCIDSLSSYYWISRLNTREGDAISMDAFKKKILTKIRSNICASNVSVMYTIPTYFANKTNFTYNTTSAPMTPHFRVTLSTNILDKGTYIAEVQRQTCDSKYSKVFKLTPKLEWCL